MLRQLVSSGEITSEQADWAGRVPMAQDVTGEADSAGHTDNRPAVTLCRRLWRFRNRFQEQYDYAEPLRVGAAAPSRPPQQAAAAFTMGAAYIVTGFRHQACVDRVPPMSCARCWPEAEQAGHDHGASADMFEMGVKLQVLKRGTCSRCGRRSCSSFIAAWTTSRDRAADRAMWKKYDLFAPRSTNLDADAGVFPGTRSEPDCSLPKGRQA